MDRVFFSFLELFLVAFPLRRDCKTEFSSSSEEEKHIWCSDRRQLAVPLQETHSRHKNSPPTGSRSQSQPLIGPLKSGGGASNRVPVAVDADFGRQLSRSVRVSNGSRTQHRQ